MDYDFDSGMNAANTAQRQWFAQNPVMPNYGEVSAGQGYAKPTATTIPDPRYVSANAPTLGGKPQVLGAPKPAQDPMLTANALLRARYAANPVVPNAQPQTDWIGHIGNMLNKILGSF